MTQDVIVHHMRCSVMADKNVYTWQYLIQIIISKTRAVFGNNWRVITQQSRVFQVWATLILARQRRLQTAGSLPSVLQSSSHQLASGNHQCKQRNSRGAQASLWLSTSPRTSLREQHKNANPALNLCIAFPCAHKWSENVCVWICVWSCVLISIFLCGLATVQKEIDQQIHEMGFSSLLPLSLYVCVFFF